MWLTTSETADALAISPPTVRRLVEAGELGQPRWQGKRLYVHVEAARKYAKINGFEVLHPTLCVQNHVLLIATEYADDFYTKARRVVTRLSAQLTIEPSVDRGLALVGFYKPRLTITPRHKWTVEQWAVLQEFCPRLFDASEFRSTHLWTVVTGKGGQYGEPSRIQKPTSNKNKNKTLLSE